MEYFNGRRTVDVNDLSTLTNLTQEQLNTLATGRQENFLNMLDNVNNELRFTGAEPIDVTPAWNWRPGTYDKFKHYLNRKLDLHKRSSGLDNLINRTYDRLQYMTYIKNRINTLEAERHDLKQLGIKRDVDVVEWQEKVNAFIEEMLCKCNDVYEKTDGRVKISLFVGELNDRNPFIYYDIYLSNLELTVFSGDTQIEKFPINDIIIKYNTSLRHKVSGLRSDVQTYGMSTRTYENPLSLHPYISNNNRYGNVHNRNYGNVCLDTFNDTFHKAMRNNKLDVAAFTLLQWASYYSLTHSNPYNQPYQCHVGAPKSMNDKYIATQSKSSILLHLDRTVRHTANGHNGHLNYYEKQQFILDMYSEYDCRFTGESVIYKQTIARKIVLDDDSWCINESAIGQILESISELPANEKYQIFNEITGMSFEFHNYNDNDDDYDENGQLKEDILYDEITDRLVEHMCENQYPKENHTICRYVERYLEKEGYYTKDNSQEIIEVVIDESTEKMKSIMKQWANGSERA